MGMPTTDFEDTRHWFAFSDTCVGIMGDRLYVVCEQNPAVLCCPCQYRWIVRTCESDILDPHQIKVWSSQEKAAHDIVVEVLIC